MYVVSPHSIKITHETAANARKARWSRDVRAAAPAAGCWVADVVPNDEPDAAPVASAEALATLELELEAIEYVTTTVSTRGSASVLVSPSTTTYASDGPSE